MFLLNYEGWETIVSVLRVIGLPVSSIVEYGGKHAFAGLLEDKETEIGIEWDEKKIFFNLFKVSDERGESIRQKVGKRVITSKATRINAAFTFSCDLQEFSMYMQEAAIPLCSQS